MTQPFPQFVDAFEPVYRLPWLSDSELVVLDDDESERSWESGSLWLKKTRDYSCLMLEMPPDLADKIIQIGRDRIPDAALAADGREDWPHITVLYGFHTDSAGDVLDELVAFGPIKFTISKISRFESDEYDVVKFDIESDDLLRLRKIVEQHPYTNTHAGYRPHITIAYVKKGTTGYSGKTELTGQEFTADNLVFSSRSKIKTQMRLDGGGALVAFTKNCGTGAGGFKPGNTCGRGGPKMLAFGGNAVDRQAGVSSHLHEIFGRNLTDEELSGISGAPSGSEVSASLYLDDFDRARGVYVEWKNEAIGGKSTCYLYRNFDGPKVANQGLDVKDGGNGYGTQILKHQVETAEKLGISSMSTIAERSATKNGYYTWPRLGYDSRELGLQYKEKLSDGLKDAKRVSDLMRTEEGRQWWKKHGEQIELMFNTKPGSYSRNTLDAYYNARFGTGTTATQTDGKPAGNDGRGRTDSQRDLGQHAATKGRETVLSPDTLTAKIFDPADWSTELINRALPVLAQSACRAAVAQMRVMGVDLRKLKSAKSTASEWLETVANEPDSDFPATAFDTPYGQVSMKIATEMPPWMKERIKDHIEETFAEDYWQGMLDTTRDDIRDFLKMSIGEGWSIRDMADRIQETLGGGDYAGWRARTIARTESGHALNGARSVSADALIDEMAEYNLPVVKSWLSVLGTTTRKEHADLDGVPADKDGLWTLAGVRVRWPGDVRLPVEQRANCQCSLVTDLGVDNEMAQRLIDDYTERAGAKSAV